MYAKLPKIISGMSLFISLAGCGVKDANYRKNGVSGLDAAAAASKVDLSFTLPDRSADTALTSTVNGYYYRLQGEGSKCPSTEDYESVAAYEDKKVIHLRVSSFCNYSVKIKIGSLAAPGLTAPINYQDDVKKLVAAQCVSCHATYTDYAELVKNGEQILHEVEAGTMPPKAPLGDADVATLLSWADGGYLENNPDPSPTTKEQALSAVYYRNNNNDMLMSYELLSRESFELRRSLWLQESGEKLGLTLKEIRSYDSNASPSP